LTDSFLSSGQPIRTKLNLPDRSESTLQSCTFFFVYLKKTGMTVHRKWDKLTINRPPLGTSPVKHWCWLVTGEKCKRVEGLERIGLTLLHINKQGQAAALKLDDLKKSHKAKQKTSPCGLA